MDKKIVLEDFRRLSHLMGQVDYQSYMVSNEELYDDDTIEYINKLCDKYNIKPINKEDIDWEWCNLITETTMNLEDEMKKIILGDDNMENDIAIIAHEVFNNVNDNYEDNGDVGDDDFMKQVESYMCANNYDDDTINEVKKIIDNEYLVIL